MMSVCLAIDIGASSGRHIVGRYDGTTLETEELYRFRNGISRTKEGLVWDVKHLEEEVLNGLREAGRRGIRPDSIAIDTWGVDYVLLDENRKELFPVFAYRDGRTQRKKEDGKNAVESVQTLVSQEELYSRTGIQFQQFNTIYQLRCDQESGKLKKAAYFLMIPEYLTWKLTGKIRNEYTNATTTNLVNAGTGNWDTELMKRLQIPERLFQTLQMPASDVGELLPEVRDQVGFQSRVVFCPSHDTASAVCACPLGPKDLYLSSGTWSLMGMESLTPFTGPSFQKANFTNEGGINRRFRILKNIMGMWLIQNVQTNMEAELGRSVSYEEMVNLAENSSFSGRIDVNHPGFVAPENMIEAIRENTGCRDLSFADVIRCVYVSLAEEYQKTVREIESLSGNVFEHIHVVGGGCRNSFLNQMTADATRKTVFAGPVEATACGNLVAQLMNRHPSVSLEEARILVRRSFPIKKYEPGKQ